MSEVSKGCWALLSPDMWRFRVPAGPRSASIGDCGSLDKIHNHRGDPGDVWENNDLAGAHGDWKKWTSHGKIV
jgi:hypothetical protein